VRQAGERHLRDSLPPLRLSWSFMLAANLACAGLGVLAVPVVSLPGKAPASPLAAAIAAFGALVAAATLWLDRRLLAPSRIARVLPVPDPALARRHLLVGHLALWSLAEVPALLGFAQVLLDGTLGAHLALCATSLVLLALLLPTRARITSRMEALLG